MEKKPTKIPGCFKLQPIVHNDSRGTFIKFFHKDIFNQLNLPIDFAEEYYSISKKNVLRGLHFQTPPMDHDKLIFCPHGHVLDVVVDIRRNSPAYGKYQLFDLNNTSNTIIYIPKGCAHGFYTLEDNSVIVYKVTSIYSPKNDTGILWNSLDINWPTKTPFLSERDSCFMPFSEFITPFIYNEA